MKKVNCIILMLSAFETVCCFRCYDCDFPGNDNCTYPFSPEKAGLVQCSGACHMKMTTLNEGPELLRLYDMGCSSLQDGNECVEGTKTKGSITYVSICCYTDLCNGGQSATTIPSGVQSVMRNQASRVFLIIVSVVCCAMEYLTSN